ncbi:MAG: 50S ribosomal protein L23 [Elusimicrobia bacterium]|nr:50S ribosomal protein L23 [Elusimicrobiota bacterium]
MLDTFNIIKRPLITEKTTNIKDKENKFVFIVAKNANKNQIKKAVEDLFNVEVVDVHTSIMSGKLRRMGVHAGYRSDLKKAIVKIKKGQTIKLAEGV